MKLGKRLLSAALSAILLLSAMGELVPTYHAANSASVPSTAAPTSTAKEEIDFRVLSHAYEWDGFEPEFQLFIARSMDDLATIGDQIYGMPDTDNLNAAFFQDRAVIIILRNFSVTHKAVIVDQLLLDQNRLTVYTTSASSPSGIHSNVPQKDIFLLSVRQSQIENVDSYAWKDTWRTFEKGEEEKYSQWFQNWLDSKMQPPTGDVNRDEAVNTTDARLVLQHAVGKGTLDGVGQTAADVNRDGHIDTTDARLILQYAVELIDSFPGTAPEPEPAEEAKINFCLLKYFTLSNGYYPEGQIFLAQSSEELALIREQIREETGETPNIFLSSESFTDRAVMVVVHSYFSDGLYMIVDNMRLDQHHLTVDITTGYPGNPYSTSTNILVLSVLKTDIEGLDSFSCTNTMLQFFGENSWAGDALSHKRLFQWFEDWMFRKKYLNLKAD